MPEQVSAAARHPLAAVAADDSSAASAERHHHRPHPMACPCRSAVNPDSTTPACHRHPLATRQRRACAASASGAADPSQPRRHALASDVSCCRRSCRVRLPQPLCPAEPTRRSLLPPPPRLRRLRAWRPAPRSGCPAAASRHAPRERTTCWRVPAGPPACRIATAQSVTQST